MAHTPGPWYRDGFNVRGQGGHEVAQIANDDHNTLGDPIADEAWANTRLIASAPDLLAALKAVRRELDCFKATEPIPTDLFDDEITAIRAAIAKAEA